MKATINCTLCAEDKINMWSVTDRLWLDVFQLEGDNSEFVGDLALDAKAAREMAAKLIEFADGVEKPKAPASKLVTVKPIPRYSALSPLAQLIYRHMQRAGSISAREAMADHGVTSASLARRICDIEQEGFKVERDRRVHPLTRKAYTRYSLAA